MASFRSKVKSAVKKVANKASSAAKNVAGGAKIVSSAVKNTVNRGGGSSKNVAQSFRALNSNNPTSRAVMNSPQTASMNQAAALQNAQKREREKQVLATGLAGPTVRPARSVYERNQERENAKYPAKPASSITTSASNLSGVQRPSSSFMTVSPLLANRQSSSTNIRPSGMIKSSGGSSVPRPKTDFMTPLPPPKPPVADSGDGPIVAQGQTTVDGQTGIEKKSYTMPGQKGLTPQEQLSQAQSSLIAMQSQLGERKQAATEAAATATTPEELDDTEAELERIDRQERALERQYEKLLQQSGEETQAQSQIDALTAQEAAIEAGAREGITNVEGQPIAQGFITGQSAGIQKMANSRLESVAAQKIPLNLQLARAQSQRQAALDVAKNRLSNISEKRRLYEDRRKERKSDLRYNQERADADRKFEEDKRRYGLDYAQREREKAANNTAKKQKISQDDINEGTGILQEQLRNSPDGYVNSGTYLDMYRTWVENGGTLSQFKTYYPPNDYLNPEDPSIPAYLRPSGGGNNNGPYQINGNLYRITK